MTPARLGKETKAPSFIDNLTCEIEAWLVRHASFCLIVLFILLSVLFVMLIFTLVGVSATESGLTYNHFSDFI